MARKLFALCAAFAAVMLVECRMASAQDFPSRPIHIVVPFPAGGSSDTLIRQIGIELAADLGQPVITENKAGAGTVIGTQVVASSAPDGYWLLVTSGATAANMSLVKSLPFDTEKDFAHVITLVTLPMVVLVNAQSPVTDMNALVAKAKSSVAPLNYGSAGQGSVGHMTCELLRNAAGIPLTHVPFQGSVPSLTSLAGGHIDLACDTVYLGASFVRNGQARALATTGPKRSHLMPQVPTVGELGIAFESTAWIGLGVRSGTPAEIITKLNVALNRIIRRPNIRAAIEANGFDVLGDTPAEATARFKVEIQNMSRAVELAGLRPQ